LRKSKVEELYDQYAKGYSTGIEMPERFSTGRAAMSFADDITWHFLLKYLPVDKSIEILDAGGGDGIWALKLLELGYRKITLTDISRGMLEEARIRLQDIKGREEVTLLRSDIANMKEIEANLFDFVFSQYDAVSYSMKPKEAIRELARVAKPSAYISVSLDTKYRRVPELIEAGLINDAELLLNTNINYDYDFPQFNLTWEELTGFYTKAGLIVHEVIGAPVFMHQVKEAVRKQFEENPLLKQRLLQMELMHCTNRSLVNFAGHLMVIGQKT